MRTAILQHPSTGKEEEEGFKAKIRHIYRSFHCIGELKTGIENIYFLFYNKRKTP